jgi:DNA-binding IscR family transcriptional regulator
MILEQLNTNPETIHFSDVIEYIDEHFQFIPTAFKNGNTFNEANQNNGSCKIFSFSKLKQLSKEETLALFGDFYRTDVLGNPQGEDHQNIRNFMEFGWEGIEFLGDALKEK